MLSIPLPQQTLNGVLVYSRQGKKLVAATKISKKNLVFFSKK